MALTTLQISLKLYARYHVFDIKIMHIRVWLIRLRYTVQKKHDQFHSWPWVILKPIALKIGLYVASEPSFYLHISLQAAHI